MLSEIRDRATGWIAWIIVTIIVIPFAFWGVNQYFAGGQEVVVATVNGIDIEQVDYRRALESRRAELRRLMGEDFEPELANSPQFRRGVLDDLIARVLLTNHAEAQGYRVGDEQLARDIQSNPRFQVNEQFSPEAYRGAVAQAGLTEAGFESRLRRQMILQQLRDGIRNSAFVTPQQQRRLVELLLQERQFDYAVLHADDFVDASEVSEAEIRQEYEANSEQYRTPERMKVEYVELSVDDLASMVDVTEEDIRQAYEQNRGRFTTDPVRRASHILIESDPDAGEQSQQEARQKAQKLLEQLRAGADFEELARKHSEDSGSAAQGGDLGRIESGMMVPPFEEALFSLKEEGALAGPVRTRFGFHIIKLTEYEPPEIEPLEEVRDGLEKEVRAKQAEALFLDRAEAFRNISYEQPRSLEPVADQLDLEIRQSEWFTRREGSGIASSAKVREAAFSEDVYTEGLNSQAIELDINTLVVIRKLDTRPASVKPLERVRGDIETRLKRRQAEKRVADLGPELVGELKAGAAWSAVIAKHNLTDQRATLSRARQADESGPDPAVVDAVFRLPPPGEDNPAYQGLELANGDYALIRLVEVNPGDADEAVDQLEERVRDALARRRSQDMVLQYVADLREQAEVTIKEEAL